MADEDKELMELGAEPHDDELKALGAVSAEDKNKMAKYITAPEAASDLESARAGLASGGTFGFAPRIGAAMGVGMEKLAGAPVDKKRSASDIYNEYLKYNNERQKVAEHAHPYIYGGAQFAGGLASPMNKIGAGYEVGKDASLLAKMAHSSIAGARMGATAGASQSSDLTNVPQTLQKAKEGAIFGTVIGAAAPPVIGAVKGAARVTGSGLKSVFGPVGQRFGQGIEHGMEGEPNLAGEPGQLQATEERGQFAEQFVKDLHKVLSGNAKNKRELIAQALEKNQLAPKEAVDAVMQKYLQANPQLNEESARKELEQLKEMIITASEGPKKTETVREYLNPTSRSVPNDQPQYMPGEVSRMPGAPIEPTPAMPNEPTPEQLKLGPGENRLPAVSEEGVTGQAERMGAPPPETPNEFAGYEAVHKATIDPADKEARAAFEHKIHEKLADERALGKNFNDSEIQIEELPIPDSDKVRLVAKRAIQKESADEFKDQAANLVKQQKEAQKLQALLDKQNQEQIKIKQQQEVEMAKPQFEDVQRTTREGGRNLENPEELYNLQKQLQSKSQFSEGRGFSSQEMNKMSGDAAKDIAQLIKMTVPETVPVDQRLNAFNNIAESLGINTDNLQRPGGEGQKARIDAMKKLLGVLNPDAATNKSTVDQKSLDYITQELHKVHPDIGNAFEQEAAKHAENAGLIKDMSKPYEPSGINMVANAIRRNASKAAYGAGHAIGTEADKTRNLFQQYTPEALKTAAATASQSSNAAVQKLGQVLSKLATADDRTRNSMMFVLQQNAGYRHLLDLINWMNPYYEPPKSETPQAKDKHTEKYK